MDKNNHILVTGGLGYIGSHTVVALIEAGYKNITIIDNLQNSSILALNGIEKITGVRPRLETFDLTLSSTIDRQECDAFFLGELDNNVKYDAVFHFAAAKSVTESISKAAEYHARNMKAYFTTVALTKILDITNFIFSSSCTVYGGNVSGRVIESMGMPVDTASPYATTKVMTEMMLKDLATFDNVKTVSLRYFNPVGAHESLEIGENPNARGNLVPILNHLSTVENPELTIYGQNHGTYDGTCGRDYIHVMDVAEAHVKAFEFCLNKLVDEIVPYQAINIGTGGFMTVNDILYTFNKVNDTKIVGKYVQSRQGEISCIYADTALSKKLLNWEPTRTIPDALKSAHNFFNKQYYV